MEFVSKLSKVYLFDKTKPLFGFDDLDPIFKVTRGQRMLGNVLSALYLLKS